MYITINKVNCFTVFFSGLACQYFIMDDTNNRIKVNKIEPAQICVYRNTVYINASSKNSFNKYWLFADFLTGVWQTTN